eukprot:Hpha_TRINITY_DN12002_c0_g1::TRINITY_DN12002_c0_g1_i1::g.141127::m.141127
METILSPRKRKMSLFRRYCHAIANWGARPDDPEHERSARKAGTPVAVTLLFLSAFGFIARLVPMDTLAAPAVGVGAGGCLIFLANVMFRWVSVRAALRVWFGLFTLVVITMDWASAGSMHVRPLLLVVCLLDISLLALLADTAKAIGLIITLWFVVERFEAVARVGIYEAVRFDTSPYAPSCDCSEPPCSVPASEALRSVFFMSALLLDFWITRLLADAVQDRVDQLAAVVEKSQRVVASLARYDVDAAEDALFEADTQKPPTELVAAYNILFQKLRAFRRYLPQSCLVDLESPTDTEFGSSNGDEAEIDRDTATTMSLSRSTPPWAVTSGAADEDQEPSPKIGSPATDAYVGTSSPKTPRTAAQLMSKLRVAVLLARRQKPRRESTGSNKSNRSNRSNRSGSHILSPGRKKTSEFRRVTLLSSNRVGFTAAVSERGQDWVEDFLRRDVEQWVRITSEAKGTIDLISGDRRLISFNAVKTTHGHATVGVGVAMQGRLQGAASNLGTPLYDMPEFPWGTVTCAIVSGKALCGDFGGESMLRFMNLGKMAVSLHVVERISTEWLSGVLVDDSVCDHAQYGFETRLLGAIIYTKRAPDPIRLWQITEQRRRNGVSEGEWMYELAGLPPSRHEHHNAEVEERIRAVTAVPRSDNHPPQSSAAVWIATDVGLAAVESGPVQESASPIALATPLPEQADVDAPRPRVGVWDEDR